MIRSAALSGKTFLARSQENSLGAAIWNSLVVETDIGYSKHRDQKAYDRSEKSCSTPEPFDLGGQLGMMMGSEITRNHVGRTTMYPTSDGRTWDVRLGEEGTVSGFADGFLDSVVVGPSRAESFHLERIGRRLREGGTARKCPLL